MENYESNIDWEPVRDPLKGKTLHWWQLEITDILKTIPDERSIHWYWISPERGEDEFLLNIYA